MTDIRNSANWGFETRQVHIGQEEADPATGARAVPIYMLRICSPSGRQAASTAG